MKRLRIAVIHLGRRGIGGILTWELARRLRKQAQVLLVGSQFVEHGPHWEQEWGDTRLLVRTYRSPLQAMVRLLWPRPILALARHIQARHPDVLLFPMFHPWNPLLQLLLPQPAIVMVHDPIPHPGLRDWFYTRLEALSIRKAAHVVVWSRYAQTRFQERFPGKPVQAVRLGPIDFYRQWIPQPPPQPSVLLFFGRIEPYKGLEVLLQAYHRLYQHHIHVPLRIVGPGPIAKYRALLESIPTIEVINTWVADREIADHFLRAWIVVLPYRSATQSGVVPVAAAFARPVVASAVGALPEQLTAGQSGLLVPPNDPEALAHALLSLLQYPRRIQAMGQALYEEYHRQDIWEDTAQRILEVMRRVQG